MSSGRAVSWLVPRSSSVSIVQVPKSEREREGGGEVSPSGKVERWLSLRLSVVSSTALENTPIGTFVMELCSIERDWRREEGEMDGEGEREGGRERWRERESGGRKGEG